MTYWNDKDIDVNTIAEEHDTSHQKVAGMVHAAKNTYRAYHDLIAAGAAPGQIAPWIMRPGTEGTKKKTEVSATSPPEVPTSHEVEVPSPLKNEGTLIKPPGTPPLGDRVTEDSKTPPTSGGQGDRAPDLGATSLDLTEVSDEVIPRGARARDCVVWNYARVRALGYQVSHPFKR